MSTMHKRPRGKQQPGSRKVPSLRETKVNDTATVPSNCAPKGIPLEDILAFRAKGLTLEQIGTLTGCTKQTVSERLKTADLQGLENFREYKDVIFEDLQRILVSSLTAGDVKAMSGMQRITGAAILEDKLRVIRGQATSIVDIREYQVKIEAITARLNGKDTAIKGKEKAIDVPCLSADKKSVEKSSG